MTAPFDVHGVVFDAQHQPQIFVGSFRHERLLAWDGTQWQLRVSPLGDNAVRELYSRAGHVWAILDDAETPYSLVYWNAITQHTIALPLPAAHEAPFNLSQLTLTPAAQVLVVTRNNTETRILGYPLALTAAFTPTAEILVSWPTAQGEVESYAVAPNGDIWLMVAFKRQLTLQRYRAATATWQTYTLPAPECCDLLYGRSFWVDGYDRLWVPVNDLTDNLLDVWQADAAGALQRLTQYTETNSNVGRYYFFKPAQLGPDARLWTYDDALVWADTSATTLPPSLPEWLSFKPFSLGALIPLWLWLVPVGILEFLSTRRLRARLARY